MRYLLLAIVAASVSLSACQSSSPKPATYNNTQTSATTTTHNEENPPPIGTRSAQRSGATQ